jgi:signal transduction histidine kinase
LLQSAGLRFAALFTIVFAASSLALVAVLWWATAGALDRQVAAAIRADAVALTERWREAGVAGLTEAIEERIALDIANESIYLLLDRAGRKLAGNLEGWPNSADSDGTFTRARIAHDGVPADARFLRRDLPGGANSLRLLVGRDESERLQLRLVLTEGVVWSLGASMLIAIIGASLIRGALERRLEPTYSTAMGIAGGDMSHRVPISGRGDEFDRLGQGMNSMLDRIETLMQGVRGVSDAIAHDLRTPIARARSKLEESLSVASTEPELRAAVEQGIADLDNISRIFRALLRIAEAEAGARRAAFAPLDLPEVLGDAAEFYQAAAEAKDQRLETDLPRALRIVGDRDLLLQAVANMLDNAVKFTPEGGVVHLVARELADGAVEIIVSDTGPGLGRDDQSRAGERFFRADQSRNTPGSGLGLSLARAVAQLHGGELQLRDAMPGNDPPGLAVRLLLAGSN